MKNPTGVRTFGKHLRKLRTEKKLSQQHLADIANVPKITIQRIELAKFSPTLDTLISISKALGVSLNELFAYSDESKDI